MKELEPLLVVIGLAVLVGFVLGYGVRAYISNGDAGVPVVTPALPEAKEGPMTTVWIYVDTRYLPGHPDYVKVLPIRSPRTNGARRTIPKALHSNTRSWSESHRAPNHPCNAVDPGLGDPLEFVASIILPMEGRHEVRHRHPQSEQPL